MRSLCLCIVLVVACTYNPPDPIDGAGDPTRFSIAPADSHGTAGARRWTREGWLAGELPIVVESGELSATIGDGSLDVSNLDVRVAPIAIPDDLFGRPAQLTDVALSLREPATGDIPDADGTACVSLAIDLAWSISIDGGTVPLGVIHLPPLDATITLGGERRIEAAATGTLWSWAGLLELTSLELALDFTAS